MPSQFGGVLFGLAQIRLAVFKKRKRNRTMRPAPSDQEIVRHALIAAVKQCRKKTSKRIATIQITCDGNAVDVVVTFSQRATVGGRGGNRAADTVATTAALLWGSRR
jgi:hypothetical protein